MTKTINEFKAELLEKYGKIAAAPDNRRIADWTAIDFTRAEVEHEDIVNQIVYNLDCGADSPEIQKQVERYRQHLNRFYECTPELFSGLGDTYASDEHFIGYFQRYHPELPYFLQEAIKFYCDQSLSASDE